MPNFASLISSSADFFFWIKQSNLFVIKLLILVGYLTLILPLLLKIDINSKHFYVYLLLTFFLQISSTIEQILLPRLPSSPPDVEAMRVYLMLPEFHLMDNPKYLSSLMSPFASSLLSLDEVALKTFGISI